MKRWAEGVASWDFERIIPSHLDGPIAAGPKEFAHAIDIALTTDGYSQFGDDVKALEAIEKLSRDIRVWRSPGPSRIPARSVTTSPPLPSSVEPTEAAVENT